MQDDVWTPRGTPAPAPHRRRHEAEPASLDISFTRLTMFFVKASLAAALALTLTSVIWLGLLAMLGGIGAGVYLALDATKQPIREPMFDGSSVAAVIAAPPAAAPAAVLVAAPPAPPPAAAPRTRRHQVESSDAATDRLIRAEIERMRARRGR